MSVKYLRGTVIMTLDYIHEIKRKTIHLSSLWIPLFYVFTSKTITLWCIGALAIIVTSIDISRHYYPIVESYVSRFLLKILRPHEIGGKKRPQLSGASFMLIAAFLVIALFPKEIAIVSLVVLVISDTCAALIGKRYGQRMLLGKTLEGTIAFILSGWVIVIIVLLCFNAPFVLYLSGFFAVLAGAIVELQSKRLAIDDNFTIPLTVSSVMWLLSFVL